MVISSYLLDHTNTFQVGVLYNNIRQPIALTTVTHWKEINSILKNVQPIKFASALIKKMKENNYIQYKQANAPVVLELTGNWQVRNDFILNP